MSGINPKRTEICKLLHDNNVHVALLQETLHGESGVHMAGYTCYACECPDCRGVITYLRNDVQGDVTNLPSGGTDIQRVTVWNTGGKFTIYNVYSPPRDVCELPQLQKASYKKTMIAGDFNAHSPLWGYKDHNNSGQYIEQLCNSTNLAVLQDEHTKATLLHKVHKTLHRPDLTIVSADLQASCTAKVIDDVGSDHDPILCMMNIPPKPHNHNKTRWNFRKADWETFTKTTDSLLDVKKTSDMNVEDLNTYITQSILQAAKETIPQGNHKRFKPFWTKEIAKAVKDRKEAKKQLESDPSDKAKIQFKRTSAIVKKTVRLAKKQRWQNTCKKLDLRKDGSKAWKLLSNLAGKNQKENTKPIIKEQQIYVDEAKKAKLFNQHFAKAGAAPEETQLDKGLKKILKEKEAAMYAPIETFEKVFTPKELDNAIDNSKTRKSPGPDKIHNEMIKNLGKDGRAALLHLINKTWTTSTLPTAWKTAVIKPILKPGKDPNDPHNYRPISLTSCIGKIAEKMVNKRLYWWLEEMNILHPTQAGFRTNRRAEDQTYLLSQRVFDGFQEMKNTTAVFIDLKQAYDKVWRKGLLLKMRNHDIHGKMYGWIKDFLSNRTIATKIENLISKKMVLQEGLPQGSALSCTLFLIFINDLAKLLSTEKLLYADDIVIWHTSRFPLQSKRRLNTDLKKLDIYCKMWHLEVNTQKTKYTIFTKNHKVAKKVLDMKYGHISKEKEENPAYLGVIFDRQMTLDQHIEAQAKKASKRLNLIKRLASTSWGSDKLTLRTLYIGYVRSVLEYNAVLQTTLSNNRREKLEKIQNQALRFICGGMRTTPTAACEIDANIQPLEKRRESATLQAKERYLRMPFEHPNRSLIENWTPKERIKQRSILDKTLHLTEKYHLPQNRENLEMTSENPPYEQLKSPSIKTKLINESVTKSSEPNILRTTALETISEYPSRSIKIFTDGSAFKATVNAGFGALIQYHNEQFELSGACGEFCSNYEAEITAMQASLEYINDLFMVTTEKIEDIVIFTDSQSALLAYEKDSKCKRLRKLNNLINHLMDVYGIMVTLQWIPGHAGISGNENADKLAKRGAQQPQPENKVTYETVKSIIKSHIKIDWINDWTNNKTGRSLYEHLTSPAKLDNINKLERKDQSAIFRLRTGHAPLHYHLNRIQPQIVPGCPLCDHPYETVNHFLFECTELTDLRSTLLPDRPNTVNTLYGSVQQLKMTSRFYYMALSRRARAQWLLDH